jgi:hypothetical protein
VIRKQVVEPKVVEYAADYFGQTTGDIVGFVL